MSEWPEDAVRDRLIADWHIYQRKGGHRSSTDDVIVAWYAGHRYLGAHNTAPSRYLDLGCGVGSVLLMVSHKLAPQVAHGVEAQSQSWGMVRRSIAELPEHNSEFRVEHSDFREFSIQKQEAYDLVTGSPPYFPLHTGVLPADPQRRACRFEVRGGVEAYLTTAARAMAPNARFYLVFQSLGQDRVLAAASNAGLYLGGQADFVMRRDKEDPFLSVFEFSKTTTASVHRVSCVIRETNGDFSPQYQEIRRELGVSL